MMTSMSDVANNDADLVAASLSGDRNAFGQIVSRYQSLICSLAYSATGSLGQSEDLAQETFITAWKHLGHLRERNKLRSWLCGIARNRINNSLRRDGREPVHSAEPMETLHESASPEPSPQEQSISREEEAILWRSLEQIPETYREPLVLFYREHQSVERVAAALELSEDAVKQRLSRGRKLLQEQVIAFVEGALVRSTPGKAFTLGVIAVLPAMTISAKAATLGAAVAKGTTAAKGVGALGVLGAVISPVLSFFGMWMGYRMSQDSAQTEREREFNRRQYKRMSFYIGGFVVLYGGLMFCGDILLKINHELFLTLAIGVPVIYVICMAVFSRRAYHERRRLIADLTSTGQTTDSHRVLWEYRSRFQLFGLPFIHIRLGDRRSDAVKAWFAVGDIAFGVLFAFGGIGVAPISIAGIGVGLISFSGLSIGALAVGGMCLGVWSFGGLAIGWQAFGGCAIAWNAAWGGYAIAHDYALGGVQHALHANTVAVQDLLKENLFFKVAAHSLPYLFWMNLIWIIPLKLQSRLIARKRREQLAA